MAARFLKAVLSGTVAAAALPVLVIVDAAVSYRWRLPGTLPFYAQLGIAFAVSLGLVTAATLLVGAPGRMALRRLGMESTASYMIIGGLGGAGFVMALLALIGAGPYVEILSTAVFSGAVTGYVWERSRPRR